MACSDGTDEAVKLKIFGFSKKRFLEPHGKKNWILHERKHAVSL
jgi:hypothetical protein